MLSVQKNLHSRYSSDLVRIAVVLLLVFGVIGVHVINRTTSDLSPWKGGGFAMFSTIDSPGDRILKTQLYTDVGVVNVAAPPQLGDQVSAVLAAPSKQRLNGFAAQLANQIWVTPQFDLDALIDETSAASPAAIAEALTVFAESASVRTVDEELFDPQEHRRLLISQVEVSVYRLDAAGATDLEPAVLAQTTISNNSGQE